MNVFATKSDKTLTDGMMVLKANLEQMQEFTREEINNRFIQMFREGIFLNSGGSLPFNIAESSTGKVRVHAGMCCIDTDGVMELVSIATDGDTVAYNASNPTQTTNNNTEEVLTPKSTGCYNIPIPNDGETYYIGIKYLLVCDNGNTGSGYASTNYSIKPKIVGDEIVGGEQLYYTWRNGYEIVIQNTAVIEDGFLLGTVVNLNNVLTIDNKVDELPKVSLKDDTITTDMLVDDCVTTDKIIDEAVTTDKIIDEAVTTDKIIDEAVTTEKLADNSVTTDKIADGAITMPKIVGIYKTPFSINSGNVDSNGKGDILYYTVGTGTLKFKVGGIYDTLKATTAKGVSFELTAITDLDTSVYSNGTYTVCVKKDQATAELKGHLYVQSVAPVGSNGDLWYDTSTEGCICYEKVAGVWTTEYDGVPIGTVTTDTGVITSATTTELNQNNYNINFLTKKYKYQGCGISKYALEHLSTATAAYPYIFSVPYLVIITRTGGVGSNYNFFVEVSLDNSVWTKVAGYEITSGDPDSNVYIPLIIEQETYFRYNNVNWPATCLIAPLYED